MLVALIVVGALAPVKATPESPQTLAAVIHAAARWAGVAPELLAAVVWVESRGHPWALNIGGEAAVSEEPCRSTGAPPGRSRPCRHRSGADPLPDLGSGVRAATGGSARSVDQPARGRADPSARHGAGAGLLGWRRSLSLRDAAAEVGVREPSGRRRPRAAPRSRPSGAVSRRDRVVGARLPRGICSVRGGAPRGSDRGP